MPSHYVVGTRPLLFPTLYFTALYERSTNRPHLAPHVIDGGVAAGGARLMRMIA